MRKKLLATAVAGAVIGMAPMTASAVNFKDVIAGKTDFSFGGYVKLTAMASDYDTAEPASTSGGRLFYIPSTIATTGTAEDGNDLDIHARETRFNFKTVTKTGDHTLMSYIELDFLLNNNGNEIVSNSYNPRLRHAFFKFDNWLFGQTWSNYMDLGSLPESVDFLGPSESVVFNRQAQIRYTHGALSVSLENPEAFGGADRDDNEYPDIIARYTHKADFGHISVAGVISSMNVESGATDDTETGYGISLSGKVKLWGKDDLRFQITKQDGVGRYTGLGITPNVIDNGAAGLQTVENTAGYIALRHFWTDNLRSNIIYSMNDIDDGSGSATEEAKSLQVNLMYSPVKPLTFGIMYLAAEREDFLGNEGELKRVQAVAKYAF